AAFLPSFAFESSLPDDLLLSAQGVHFESANPLPLTDAGSIEKAGNSGLRAVRIREATPQGTIERIVVTAQVQNTEIAIGSTQAVQETRPVAESAVETLATEAELPTPEVVDELVPSTSGGGDSGPSMADVLRAELEARQ